MIEGHDTHPIEIERALQGQYSSDSKKRNLQLEAKAHIAVQEWIDQGGIPNNFFSSQIISEIHRRFCDLLPEDLLWIHPFFDGNGRVARLMSHAVTLNLLNTGGIWSISRGLARNIATYKEHLANCDLARCNDLDGRGNLSEEALAGFTEFFLESCIDQVNFMQKLMQPELLRTRILLWVREEIELGKLPSQAFQILEAILYRVEITKGEMASLLNKE